MEKIILTDADGVLFNWDYAFHIWMEQHGHSRIAESKTIYDVADQYNLSKDQGKRMIKTFNESAAIGFLPALRDAVFYVKRLHEEHGYRFHCITSLSTDENAYKLREMNLKKLFGKTAFEKLICLETGADKSEALAEYNNTKYWWIEDKTENAHAGLNAGLRPILLEHGYNMNDHLSRGIELVKDWKKIYQLITGETI